MIKQNVILLFLLFDHAQEVLHDRVKLSDIQPMTQEDYTVRGSTALKKEEDINYLIYALC